MLSTETIDPLSDPRWQRFVQCSANASIFHHREWLTLLHDQYRYQMLACCVIDEDREIVAGLPLACVRSRLTGTRLVAVPFSDSCAPLRRGPEDEVVLQMLLGEVCHLHLRERVDVEIRAELPGLGRRGDRFVRHELPLSDGLDRVTERFTKMAARGVARAHRDGVEVVRATDERALLDFYRLHVATRRRQGMPTQPQSFVLRFAALFERSLGFVLLARVEQRTIAAAVFLCFNGTLTYKYGASDKDELKRHPNNAIFVEAMRWGCDHEMHRLDLGRTDLDNEGLAAFKRGWGARELPLAYTLLSLRSARPAAPRTRRALSAAISRTPPFAGRLIGAALYRHFG